MEIIIKGMLMATKIKEVEKEGNKKVYYSLDIYSDGKLFNVGVPFEVWKSNQEKVHKEIELKDISIWTKGSYSLYIRE